MHIKTSAVFANLNVPVDFEKLAPIQDFRINRNGYLKLGNATACIFRSGKIQIYGLKKLARINDAWEQLLEILSPYLDTSKADEKPCLKYFTATDNLGYLPDLEKCYRYFNSKSPAKRFVLKKSDGTIILLSSGFVTLDGFSELNRAEEEYQLLKKALE